MGMILRIASSRIVGQGDIVGRSGYFSLNLSANPVMRGRLDARRTLKSLVADLRDIRKWIEKAKATRNMALTNFAYGIEKDWEAVQAAIDIPFNNGLLEGTVNKIKAVKRQMYNRAGSKLLRAKILYSQ